MIQNLPTLQRLVNQLRHVPYLASKNVYRVAMHFLAQDEVQVKQLCETLLAARKAIKPCSTCSNWTEQPPLCSICADQTRDTSLICVVETWHDLWALERAGNFIGVYHVLGGVLSPLAGMGPENLSIQQLLERVSQGGIKELIFATNPTPEGEATASFIISKLPGHDCIISKLASGMPTGSSLEYLDRITIYKALSGRVPF